ncbi:hypothetical protein NLO93_26615, partial [Pseudomonas savastanoi]|nr:hypothetical protein [Pseudomonas savastanoi]
DQLLGNRGQLPRCCIGGLLFGRHTCTSSYMLCPNTKFLTVSTRVFGHETPITSIDVSILALHSLNAHKSSVVTNAQILKLKFAMETAHSRYPDFQHCLTLAASISPDHALDWLVLTDKVRLLADQYGSWPLHPFPENLGSELSEQQCRDPACLAAFDKYQRDMQLMSGTLKLRVLEVIEASIFWMQRQAS